MRGIALTSETDFDGWRRAARGLLAAQVEQSDVLWSVGGADDLFAADATAAETPAKPSDIRVPESFLRLARSVILAREPQRFALLYRLLWRLTHGERDLLKLSIDPDVARAERLAHAVGRDIHKMRAFVRFRAVPTGKTKTYVAWFEPAHYIVEANAPFFASRFATMIWSILTPDRCVFWDGEQLQFGPGADRGQIPDDDAMADYWRTYYTSIFNPARLKPAAMTREMPRRYWKNLPEANAIPQLIGEARSRAAAMIERAPTSANPRIPPPRPIPAPLPEGGLSVLAQEATQCRSCPLWSSATQTVWGEGPATAEIMLVGEQPGDQEDLAGRPFVGPAGEVLDRALAEAGLDRAALYVTNAVKHFKFVPRGKRRIHQKPNAMEIKACGHWLAAERQAVAPRLIVALGASAARAVLDRPVSLTAARGQVLRDGEGTAVILSWHPSYILRLMDQEQKDQAYRELVADLRTAVRACGDPARQKIA